MKDYGVGIFSNGKIFVPNFVMSVRYFKSLKACTDIKKHVTTL